MDSDSRSVKNTTLLERARRGEKDEKNFCKKFMALSDEERSFINNGFLSERDGSFLKNEKIAVTFRINPRKENPLDVKGQFAIDCNMRFRRMNTRGEWIKESLIRMCDVKTRLTPFFDIAIYCPGNLNCYETTALDDNAPGQAHKEQSRYIEKIEGGTLTDDFDGGVLPINRFLRDVYIVYPIHWGAVISRYGTVEPGKEKKTVYLTSALRVKDYIEIEGNLIYRLKNYGKGTRTIYLPLNGRLKDGSPLFQPLVVGKFDIASWYKSAPQPAQVAVGDAVNAAILSDIFGNNCMMSSCSTRS